MNDMENEKMVMTLEDAKLAAAKIEMDLEFTEFDYCEGHSGLGWYCWDTEYPDEGSTFLGK